MYLRCEVQEALVQCHRIGSGPEHWCTTICTSHMERELGRKLSTGDRFVVKCNLTMREWLSPSEPSPPTIAGEGL